ncbi:MAG: hypothetical protein ACC661_10670 [Verrucomicrobiales bacterium]
MAAKKKKKSVAKKVAAKKPRPKKTVRKLTKTGDYTLFVTLPAEDIDELGWRAKQKVTIRRAGKSLVIEDWKG